jgi:ferric-dicitrate binding protein FerR (iron transport regulator)
MTMNCSQWEETLNAALDGELEEADRAALEAHLDVCADCRRTRDLLQAQSANLDGLRLDSEALEARIIAAVHAEPTPRRLRISLLLPFAAAAALVVVAGVSFLRTAGVSTPPTADVSSPRTNEHGTPLPAPRMHLSIATGPVDVASGAAWLPLSPGSPVGPGTRLRTQETSKCELSCPDGSLLRLDCGTEIRIQDPRRVYLQQGEVFATIQAGAQPFQFSTEDGALQADACSIDLTYRLPKETPTDANPPTFSTSVAVLAGQVRIAEQELAPRSMCVLQKKGPISSRPGDALEQTRWIHDLLKLRDPDDPEVIERVVSLLGMLGATRTPALYEGELRAFGQRSAPGLLAVLNRTPDAWDAPHRRHAARLLGDIAGPSEVEALLPLLRDGDREVSSAADRALSRITGATLKSADAWGSWFQENRGVWGAPKPSIRKP